MNSKLTISSLSLEDKEHIDNKIVEFNSSQAAFTQEPEFINIDYAIKDNGIVIAGITAILYCWKILHINILWVDEKYRRSGYGSRLLTAVEEQAKKDGCTLSHLDTFDFQAKDFYLKHGYEIFGELDDCPPGHKRYYFKKRL